MAGNGVAPGEPGPDDLDTACLATEALPGKRGRLARALTIGEVEMARLVYGDAVEYPRVRVHNYGYWMFCGLQDKRTAVCPNGKMYFPSDIYRDDYSAGPLAAQQHFIHEMAHVWQYQLGYRIKWVRVLCPWMRYDYVLDGVRQLHDFNMEAQADLLADYFLAVFRGAPELLSNRRYRGATRVGDLLRSALGEFLADRGSRRNLPRRWW